MQNCRTLCNYRTFCFVMLFCLILCSSGAEYSSSAEHEKSCFGRTLVGLYERVLKFKPQIDTVGRPLSHDIFISVLLTCSTVVV